MGWCVWRVCDHSASCDRLPDGPSSNPNISGPQATKNPQLAFKKSTQGYQNKQVGCQQPSEGSETLQILGLKEEG